MKLTTRILEKILQVISAGCLLALFFVLLWQILSRYILQAPSTFTEELARLLLVVMASTGAVLSFFKGKHLALDLLYQRSGPAMQKHLKEFYAVATIILGFILTIGGVFLIQEKWHLGQTSAVLGFELVYFYFLVPFCGIGIMLSPFHVEGEQ